MIIRIEPKDWNMHSVIMFFKQEEPHPEDADVLQYLEERRLEPRRRYTTELEGEQFEVLTFGGCYLGRHMNALADIQRAVVERELLAEAIAGLLGSGPDATANALAAAKSEAEIATIVDALTERLHKPDNFAIDSSGNLETTITAADVQAQFVALTTDGG